MNSSSEARKKVNRCFWRNQCQMNQTQSDNLKQWPVEKEPIRFQSWITWWRHDNQTNDTQENDNKHGNKNQSDSKLDHMVAPWKSENYTHENNIKHSNKNQSDFKAGSCNDGTTISIMTLIITTLSIAIKIIIFQSWIMWWLHDNQGNDTQ